MSPAPRSMSVPLDELTLLRSFAVAYEKFEQAHQNAVEALAAGAGIDYQELADLKAERDLLFRLWKTR